MSNNIKAPKIPAGLVAYVHDTSDGAVRTSKSLENKAGQRYRATEDRIREAVIAIKEEQLIAQEIVQ